MGDVFEFAIPCHPFNPQIRDLLRMVIFAVSRRRSDAIELLSSIRLCDSIVIHSIAKKIGQIVPELINPNSITNLIKELRHMDDEAFDAQLKQGKMGSQSLVREYDEVRFTGPITVSDLCTLASKHPILFLEAIVYGPTRHRDWVALSSSMIPEELSR